MNNLVRQNSLLSLDRLQALEYLVKQTLNVEGDLAEVGVYKGGTALLISENNPKLLHLFDTFTGLPEVDSTVDLHHKGDFADTTPAHIDLLLSGKNFKTYKGIFPQETGDKVKDLQFSFVNLDVDLYKSTLDCLEFFYPKMTKGAILVSDDYMMHSCPGVKKAMDEFMKGKKEVLKLSAVHQCYFVKE